MGGGALALVGAGVAALVLGTGAPAPRAAPAAELTQAAGDPAALALPAPEPRVQEAVRARADVDALAAGPDGLARLAAAYAGSKDGAVREQALVAAARRGEPEAVSWLADVAGRDGQLGARAAVALGSVEDRRAAPALAELAASDAPVHVRANAARALARAGGPSEAPTLLALVRDPSQPPRVRQEAALALGRAGGPRQVPELLALLTELWRPDDTAEQSLRIALVQALGHVGTAEARAGLLRHAARPLSDLERAFVQAALGGGR